MSDATDRLRSITVESEVWGHSATIADGTIDVSWWRAMDALPDAHPALDTYLGMGLTARPASSGRARAADVVSLMALAWADVDVSCDWHQKDGLAADRDEALTVLRSWAEPSIVTASPGGVQGLWLAEVVDERSPDEIAGHLADVRATIVTHARIAGVTVDPVWDAARLMRHPDSPHTRSGGAVEVLSADGPWWSWESLGDRLMDATEVAEHRTSDQLRRAAASVDVGDWSGRCPGSIRDAAAMLLGDAWAPTWTGSRVDLADTSASGHDASLAASMARSQAVTDEQIAQLITARRASAGAPPKSRMADYLRRTVAWARSVTATQDAVRTGQARVAAALEDVEAASVADAELSDPMATLGRLLGVPVENVVRRAVPGVEGSARWHIVSGGRMSAGIDAGQMLSAARCRAVITEAFGRVPPPIKAQAWQHIADAMVRHASDEWLPDESSAESMRRFALQEIAERAHRQLTVSGSVAGVGLGVVAAVDLDGDALLLARSWVRDEMLRAGERDYGAAAHALGWGQSRRTLGDRRPLVWVVPLGTLTTS